MAGKEETARTLDLKDVDRWAEKKRTVKGGGVFILPPSPSFLFSFPDQNLASCFGHAHTKTNFHAAIGRKNQGDMTV